MYPKIARVFAYLFLATAGVGCSTEVTSNPQYWGGDQAPALAWIPGHEYKLTSAAALVQVQGREDVPCQFQPNRAGQSLGTVVGYYNSQQQTIIQQCLPGTRVKVTKLIKHYDIMTGLESLNVEGRILDGPRSGYAVNLDSLSSESSSGSGLNIPLRDARFTEPADNTPNTGATTASLEIPADLFDGSVGVPYP